MSLTNNRFYKDVEEAAALGWVQGDGSLLRPNDPVTRQEAILMIVRAAGVVLEGGNDDLLAIFKDGGDVAVWAKLAILYALQEGWMQGMGDGKLAPRDFITRGQAAAIFR